MQHFARPSQALAPLALVLLLCGAVAAQVGSVSGSVRFGQGAGFGGALVDDDEFGSALALIDDLDGDGVRELVVGAPGDSASGADAGVVWLAFLNADGTAKSQLRIGNGSGGLAIAAGDRFGSALAWIDDLDGDGLGELAVGAPGSDFGFVDAGALWVLFLAADGSVRSAQRIGQNSGGLGNVLAAGDRFGSSVAGLGDRDGDGRGDLAVGSEERNVGGNLKPEAGAVWLLGLSAQGTASTTTLVTEGAGGFGGTLGANDHFGSALADLGDLDDDGLGDFAVGAENASSSGSVWVLFGQVSGGVRDALEIGAGKGGFGGTLELVGGFGNGLAALDDLDGDGRGELVVGEPSLNGTGPGKAWILFLNADGTVADELAIGKSIGGFGGLIGIGDRFGSGLAGAGDFDGDGDPELWVGAPLWRSLMGDPGEGTGFLLSLCASDLVAAFDATPTAGDTPLTVAFTDRTSGAPSAWSWDFGDGGSASVASPTHVYKRPGTYTVTLFVSGAAGSCAAQALDLLIVDAGPASATPRNGSGTNPDAFDSVTLPILGTTWSSTVDAAAAGASSGLSFLFGFPDPLSGFPTAFGELLIDPTGGLVTSHVTVVVAGTAQHAIAVPNDLALEGFLFATQVFVGGTSRLTNALDLVLGF